MNIFRIERDLLGDREVPAEAYFGGHMRSAVENPSIAGPPISIYPELVNVLAAIKTAAARANMDLGRLPPGLAGALVGAAPTLPRT